MITIYRSTLRNNHHVKHNHPCIEEEILKDQQIHYRITVDDSIAMKLLKGHGNPFTAQVLVDRDNTIILDYFDLVKYIERLGLRLI